MKKIILLTLILLLKNAFPQSPAYEWAKSYGLPGGRSVASAVAIDASANVYVTGSFAQSIVFGTYTLTSNGGVDIFVAKLDSSSNVIWAKNFGGSLDYEEGLSIAVDGSGNVFFTGDFNSPMMIIGNDTLYNSDAFGNSYDIYITKLDPSGDPLWAKAAGGYQYEKSFSVTTDGIGNSYITGGFDSQYLVFDQDTVFLNTAPGAGFVTKFDPLGNTLWAKSIANVNAEGNGVVAEAGGDIYLTGVFHAPSINLGSYTLTNADPSGTYHDFFIAKLSAVGNVIWASSYGGALDEFISGISLTNNLLYVTGIYMSDTVAIGSVQIENVIGYPTAFTAGFHVSGSPKWAKGSIGMVDQNQTTSVASDNKGNVYITGAFTDTTLTFDGDTLINAAQNGYFYDVFITKYDSAGNLGWVKGMGGAASDEGWGIAVYAEDNLYVTGYFVSPSIICGTHTLVSADTNWEEVFLVKIGQGNNSNSVDKESLSGYFDVSPNPTSGFLRIKIPKEKMGGEGSIRLIDLTSGEDILEKKINLSQNEIPLDISSFPESIYALIIQLDSSPPFMFKVIRVN